MSALLRASVRPYHDAKGARELLAFADLAVAGLLIVKGLRVLKSKATGEPYVTFPMRRSSGGAFFEVVSPTTPKAREEIKKTVLRAFGRAAKA